MLKKVFEFIKKHKYIILAALATLLVCTVSIGWILAEKVSTAANAALYQTIYTEYDTTTKGIENGKQIEQHFTTSKSICGVVLKFNTNNQTFNGTINVELYENEKLLTKGSFNMAQLLNGVPTNILFDDFIEAKKDASYTLKVGATYQNATGEQYLTLWKNSGYKANVIENGEKANGAIFLSTIVSKTDEFLTDYYLIIAVIIVISVAICFALIFIVKAKLHIIFFVAALTFGLAYNLVFPPNTTPDEKVHINTSYFLASKIMGEYTYFSSIGINPHYNNYDIDSSKFDAYSYKTIKDDIFKTNPTDEVIFQNLSTVSQISKLSYLPMATGMIICKLANANYVTMVFVARLFNLLSFALITAFAIKLIPFGKKIIFAVGLLPMTISIASSVSYDAFVIAVSMLFIAFCIKFAYSQDNMSHKKTAILSVVAAVLAPCKSIYIFICGMCLIIPKAKFKTKKIYFASMATILMCATISFFYVNFDLVKPYLSFIVNKTEYVEPEVVQTPEGTVTEVEVVEEETGKVKQEIVVDYVAKVYYTPSYILNHKRDTIKLIINTFTDNTHYYLRQLVGGHLSEPILKNVEINGIFVALLYLCLILACLQTKKELQLLKPMQKLWSLFVVACVCAVLLVVVVGWTPAGSVTIWGMQGRYLLPVLPLIMFAFSGKGITLEKDNTSKLAFGMCALHFFVILNAFSVIISGKIG